MKVNTNNKKANDKETVRINIGVSILLAVVLSFISVGYAIYGQRLGMLGNVTFQNNQGVVAITDVTFVTSSSYNSSANPAFTDDSIDFNLTYEKEQGTTHNDYRAVFEVTIDNDTYYDYAFDLAHFQPVIQNSQGVDVDRSYLQVYLAADGPQLGDSIPAGESITFQIYMDFNPPVDDTYTVGGEMNTELEEQPHGSVMGSIPQNSSGNLQESLNHDIVSFTVDVINTYQSQRTFTLSISDTTHFQLVNQNGTPLSSFTIDASTEQTYTFYVMRVSNAVYANSTYDVTITLIYNEGTDICGSIELVVDEAQIEDTTPPRISNVLATIADASSCDTSATTMGQVTVTWNSTIPDSGIKKFYVISHNTSTNVTSSPQDAGTNYNSETGKYSYTFSGLAAGSYYFEVYGINNDGYGGSSTEIANYGATNGPNGTSYTWQYTVSLTGDSEMTTFSNGKVNRGCTYTGTLNAKTEDSSNYYYVPTTSSGITVTVGTTTYNAATSSTPQEGYFYYPSVASSSTSATIYVYYVRGTVTITANGTSSSKSMC